MITDGYYPQARIVTDRSVLLADVLIQGEKYKINPDAIPQEIEAKEGNSLVLFPALVDLHSRSGSPCFEARETLASLKECAGGGGFYRVALEPYQPIDRLGVVDYFAGYTPHPFLLWGAVLAGEKLPEYGDFTDRVVGFAHTKPLQDLLLLRRALEYLAPYQKPVLLVPQQAQLATGVMAEGYYALKFGLEGIPAMAETSGLASILDLVRLTHCPVHILGISCKGSLALLEQAKNEGLPVTASVLWTHLLWNSSDLKTYNPHLRLHPPLPNPLDQTELIKAVKIGTIDGIAISHSPYTYEEKMVPFEVAPPGTIGLQFAFSLLWSNLVTTKQLSPLELLQATRIKPAEILGIPLTDQLFGFLPEASWQLNAQTSLSLSANTILWQQNIKGKILPLYNQET